MGLKPNSLLRSTIDQAFQKMLVTIGGFIPSYVPADFSYYEHDYTVGPVTLYVDPTGNDENLGTSQSAPLRQIQAALERLPKHVRHFVNIKVSPGSYNGFGIQGFTFEPLWDGSPVGIFIEGGTSATTELTQGTASGTITSSVTGNANTATWTQVFDNTQNWAVNALKGKMAKWVVAGTTTILEIVENDATSFKVMTSTVAPTNGTAYTVCDANVVLNGTGVTIPGSLPTLTSSSTTSSKAWIAIFNNLTNIRTTTIRIEGVRVAPATTATVDSGIIVDTGSNIIALGRIQINPLTGSTTPLSLLGNGTVSITSMSLTGQASAVAAGSVISSVAPNITTNGFLVIGGVGATFGINLGSAHGQGVSLFNSQIEAPICINVAGFCQMIISGVVRLTGGSSQAIRSRFASGGIGGFFCQLAGGSSLDCPGRSTAIELVGHHHFVADGNLIISNSANGVWCQRGAMAQISAGSSMSNVTTELQVDSTPSTLAAMRAANPRVISSPYGSYIYE